MRLIVFQTKLLGLPVSLGAFSVNRLLAANRAIAMINMNRLTTKAARSTTAQNFGTGMRLSSRAVQQR
jgi:hypothetical protein